MTPLPAPIAPPGKVTLTIVFDNYSQSPALETEWGYACLVETDQTTVLFDTGSVGAMLLQNMAALGKDLSDIQWRSRGVAPGGREAQDLPASSILCRHQSNIRFAGGCGGIHKTHGSRAGHLHHRLRERPGHRAGAHRAHRRGMGGGNRLRAPRRGEDGGAGAAGS